MRTRPAERKPHTATPNRALAEIARAQAASAPAGSQDPKAWGCVAVALSTTGSHAGARKVLSLVTQADIRAQAVEHLDELTETAKEKTRA